MKKEVYLLTQMKLITLAKEVQKIDLDGFLRTIKSAETVGPMLDPTMYQKAQKNLQTIKKLAESFVPIKDAFDELLGAVVKTAAEGHMELPKSE